MDTFVQYQSARAIRDAARQPGGMAGIGAGAAVGRTVAQSMAKSLDSAKETKENKTKKTEKPTTEKASVSVADQLVKYKDLLDKGILTQEEYDEVKTILLKEI
jgi:membrane protease subunit (stomatin/prohibitin family)